MGKPVGDILDAIGVTLTLNDGDLLTDALVLVKVVEDDGSVRLAIGWSEGMSWIERLGLVSAAYEIEKPTLADKVDGD